MYFNPSAATSAVQVWRKVFEQISFSLITFQVVMVGLMLIKGAVWQPLAILPLPIVSVITMASFKSMFGRSQRVLSLRAATDLDHRDQVCRTQSTPAFQGSEFRVHPTAPASHLLMDICKGGSRNPQNRKLQP